MKPSFSILIRHVLAREEESVTHRRHVRSTHVFVVVRRLHHQRGHLKFNKKKKRLDDGAIKLEMM